MHKKNLVKYFKTKKFSVSIDRALIEYQLSQAEARLEKSRNFQLIEITLNGLKFWKTEFFEKLQKIMQKLLKPRNFINEMHKKKFKCFSKIGVFNPKLQNKVFNHQKHNFCQPLTIFCIKHHRKHNLGWPNQIHTQIHVLSLAKNNL